ncbi:uncharacterized protein G2W53_031648 [Senna tora]|uniref:Uncharacterized protein n=1 Tax=Senna tora TaxID=362788 RepID=A0A834THU6_9FABA|nr:uncharacterized protein G2W53_031648 [Senna tora]
MGSVDEDWSYREKLETESAVAAPLGAIAPLGEKFEE